MSKKLIRMFVILYDDGTTCLTRWKPDMKNDTDIVAVREVRRRIADGLWEYYHG